MSTPASAFSRSCANHPEVVADLRACSRCRKQFCPDCLVELRGKPACASCKDEILRDFRSGMPEQTAIAGADQRFFGSLIDGLVFVPVLAVYGFLMMTRTIQSITTPALLFAFHGLYLAYDALTTTYGGQSLGKRAMSIKVVTSDGAEVEAGRAWMRAISRLVMNLTCLGVIDALFVFSTLSRTLHDRVAGTIVVNASN
jgi:uncharacterized RDD family membrane protein YckC